MRFEYRVLNPNERLAYREIRLESLLQFPSAFGEKYADAVKIDKFQMEEVIEKPIITQFVMGLFFEEILSGICVFIKKENHTAFIYQMYVREQLQGKKAGYQLMQATLKEALDRFPNIDILLEVARDNHRAFKLYQDIGFEMLSDDESVNTILMQYSCHRE